MGLLGLALVSATPAGAAPLLPDLVSDPPTPRFVVTATDAQGTRLLARFDGYVHNAGPGVLELRGTSPFGPLGDRLMANVVQRVYDEDGGFEDRPSPALLRYETNDDHLHWHFMDAARYSLWDYDRTHAVGPSMKVGFCLADIEQADPDPAPFRYDFFGEEQDRCAWFDPLEPDSTGPEAPSVLMGISPGWRDVYGYQLAFQWVDVSDVLPGHYWLRAEMNPTGTVLQDPSAPADTPAFSTQAVTIPGYAPLPTQIAQVPAGAPATVTLQTESIGKDVLYDRRFQIVDPPRHGTLTLDGAPLGSQTFRSAAVTYTPHPGYLGTDAFEFTVRDATNEFPRHPPGVTVTMEIGDGDAPPLLAISGAPPSLHTGAAVQLHAALSSGSAPLVKWKVDGVTGGDAVSGTISPSGVYTAPQAVPPGGLVRVRATAVDGLAAEVPLQITSAPVPRPAPDVLLPTADSGLDDRRAPSRDRRASGRRDAGARRLASARRGRRLLVRVVPARSARLRLVVRHHRRKVGRCVVRVVASRPATCAIRLPRRYAHAPRVHGRLLITATFLKRGRAVAIWRARTR